MVPRKLPLDLEEEILIRVPPLSLVRFRSVCKEWNTLFKNKRFVNKNFACSRPEFMLKTHSNIYSISVNLNDDPTIKVRDLCFGLRGNHRFYHYGTCDGYFFMYDYNKGGVVWNPLLRQIKWVAEAGITCGKSMGYDGNRPEKSYKIIGIWYHNSFMRLEVSEFATKAWKVTDHHTSYLERSTIMDEAYDNCRISLNGNVYWPAHNLDTGEFFIRMLDYSKEIIMPFCILPCKAKKKFTHYRVLSLYKGDRFSVLEQRESTREIEIWVTKKKIGNGDDVVWIKFMNVSIPNFPNVCHKSSSYFVDNNIYGKSYVVCFPSKKPAQAWVYIVRGDLCKKFKIDEVDCEFQSSVFVPSLITIP